jgi:hypothetical protein
VQRDNDADDLVPRDAGKLERKVARADEFVAGTRGELGKASVQRQEWIEGDLRTTYPAREDLHHDFALLRALPLRCSFDRQASRLLEAKDLIGLRMGVFRCHGR